MTTNITVDFAVATDDTARARAVVDDVLQGAADRLDHHAEANADSDDPDPAVTWRSGDPHGVSVVDARRRLGLICHVVDTAALIADMNAATGTTEPVEFAALDDDTVFALLAKYDRPGVTVRRTAATTYSPETADVGIIMPSGDYTTLRCTGPDLGMFGARVPQVSWPSIGSVASVDAMAFGSALSFAAGVAATLDATIVADTTAGA